MRELRLVGRVAALLAGVVGLVTASSTAAAGQPAGVGDYVALGDSYSSGVGTGVYDPTSGPCARSPLSYPPLWVAEHHPASFGFVAC
ncbi:MAG TPA: lipase, partial [Pseudonocardiaceae bacterium]|nr:lipase [Pseudonocardiaceae bacterium]